MQLITKTNSNMKKITLGLCFALTLLIGSNLSAQVLNESANWPSVDWLLTGTYSVAAGALEADPTVDANFAYDDDDAGNGSDDSIAAESPVIDLTAAFGAGETLLTVNVDYVYRKFSVEEFLRFQYFDADAVAWVNWEPESMPGNDFTLTDDFCAGTPVSYTTVELDIASFTALQQSGFQYRILFDDDPNGAAWEYGFCLNSPTITSAAPLTCAQAVVNGTAIVNDCGNGQFQLDVDVDSVGDATFINDGTTTFAIAAGSNIVGPYASGTNVSLTIEHSDTACDFTLADTTFTCPTIPGVDAILTINGCLDVDSFNDGLYDASVKDIYWAQLDYDGGCFELTVDTEGGDFDTEIGLYDSNGFLIENDDDDGTDALSTITIDALPAGTYYIAAGAFNMAFGADNFNVTSTQTATTGSLFINASTPSDNTVDFCNLQFPFEGNIETGQNFDVFTQVFESGVTEPQGAQGAGIVAWIGVSETDATTTADFTSGDWTWILAEYNVSGPATNNDEYFAEIGSGRTEGVYYYVSRYSIDGGPFTYGGINPGGSDGNFWDGTNFVSGELTVTNPPPPSNDLCENATPIACDDVLTGQTTIQATGGSATSCNGTIGDDVWYQISGNDTEITITVDASVQEGQIGVYESTDGTCGGFTLGTCVASVDDLGGNPTSVAFLANSGTEYFIQIGNWINGDPGLVFQISATCTTCPAPSNLDANNFTETTADLSWDENGTSTEWNIEYGVPGFMQGSGTTLAPVSTNPYALTGLTTETDYEYYVQADCGGETSDWVGPFAFSTLPPAPSNDDCSGAIPLTPGVDFAANPVDGSVIGATLASETNNCGVNGPGVWYSVVVPADGNITIETGPDSATGDTAFDSVIEAYSGVCGSLNLIECDDDDAATFNFSILDLTGLNSGETIYIRVWEYGGDENEPFAISAYNATLSLDSFENENAFAYFPNPVKNLLTLKSRNVIQNVSVINMLGQEVLRATPNTIESNLDMNTLNQGAYFVKVTINDSTETIRIIKQ